MADDRLQLTNENPDQTIERSDPALRLRSLTDETTLEIDMAIAHQGTETETWEITLGLRVSGAVQDLTLYTLTDVYVTGNDGIPVNTSGKTRIISNSAGTVGYKPASTDLVATKSPYRVRVKITETASGLTRVFPNREPDEIVVYSLR